MTNDNKPVPPFAPGSYLICVKQKVAESISDGGIILVDETIDANQLTECEGELVAIGPDAFKPRFDYELPPTKFYDIGDTVYFHRARGTKFKDDDGSFWVYMNDEELIGKKESGNE